MRKISFTILLFISSFSVFAQGVEDDNIYTVVESKASFPGGNGAFFEYLKRELTPLPADSLKGTTEVRVYIEFVIRKNGEIDKNSVKVIKGSLPFLNDEAIRVVKAMPAWTPGRHNGKPVNSKFVLPIRYR